MQEYARTFFTEPVYSHLTFVSSNTAVNTFVQITALYQVVLQNIEDADHLRENQHLERWIEYEENFVVDRLIPLHILKNFLLR